MCRRTNMNDRAKTKKRIEKNFGILSFILFRKRGTVYTAPPCDQKIQSNKLFSSFFLVLVESMWKLDSHSFNFLDVWVRTNK
jgi:hypothetical protein